jgi:CheY-like chemotaxis protein
VIGIGAGTEALRILVVDDQLENRDWLAQLLTSIGFSVRGAENGETGIRAWEEWAPHLIVMDMHMPVMDGLEATRKIKSTHRGKQTIIVALTASALDEDRRMVLESGADDFLAKPCRLDEVLGRIGALLKISYEYEPIESGDGAVETPAVKRVAPLPPELIEELRFATSRGNKKLLDQLILRVEETEDAEFATALRQLADNYEYDALIGLLEKALPAE